MVSVIGAAERQVGSFFADIFHVEQNIARQLALNPKAPALFIRRLVRTRSAQWAVRVKANVVHQSQLISRWLNQSVGKRITQVRIRGRVVGWISRNYVCVLVETLAAIRRDSRYSRP